MSQRHHFKIAIGEPVDAGIEMDGRPLHGVTDVRVDQGVEGMARITVTFEATAEIEGEAEIVEPPAPPDEAGTG